MPELNRRIRDALDSLEYNVRSIRRMAGEARCRADYGDMENTLRAMSGNVTELAVEIFRQIPEDCK